MSDIRANGNLVINPEEAKGRASEMVRLASELEALLNDVSRSMEDIDNVETGIYQGNNRPAELRASLDDFRATFHRAYEQITKSAQDLTRIADTVVVE